MSLFNRIFGGGDAPVYPTDELNINGKSLKLSFYAHASIAIEYEGRRYMSTLLWVMPSTTSSLRPMSSW